MNHADFYTAILTLTPVFLAASFYACRPQLKARNGWVALSLILFVVLPGLANFCVGFIVLGDLSLVSDTFGVRVSSGIVIAAQLSVATLGFLVQAIGDKSAQQDVKWPRWRRLRRGSAG
jgi:hypothetical protein